MRSLKLSTSKAKRVIDDGRQITIFQAIQEAKSRKLDDAGSMRCMSELQQAMRTALKACPLSRYEVAGRMSHLLNEEISKSMIDAWTCESKADDPGRHVPAEFLPAFCSAVGSHEPMDVLDEKAGRIALDGLDAMRAEIHRMKEESRNLMREVRKREELLEVYGTKMK